MIVNWQTIELALIKCSVQAGVGSVAAIYNSSCSAAGGDGTGSANEILWTAVWYGVSDGSFWSIHC